MFKDQLFDIDAMEKDLSPWVLYKCVTEDSMFHTSELDMEHHWMTCCPTMLCCPPWSLPPQPRRHLPCSQEDNDGDPHLQVLHWYHPPCSEQRNSPTTIKKALSLSIWNQSERPSVSRRTMQSLVSEPLELTDQKKPSPGKPGPLYPSSDLDTAPALTLSRIELIY